ncbi:MAG: glycosyltransferase family 4 protein [Halobacteriota archaeon]
MIRLTIWMNMPSFYQSDLFTSLLATGDVDLQVIFARNLSPDRVQLGWQKELSGFSHRFLDESNPIRDAMQLAWRQRDRVHVVNGIWAEPAFTAALLALMLAGSKYAIYSEAQNPNRLRTRKRAIAQRQFGRMVVRKAAGLLSVSRFAADFFKALGASPAKIYPFGYFRSKPGILSNVRRIKSKDEIEVVFVGQLVHRKGVDLLVEAMCPLFRDYPYLKLTLVGNGVMQTKLDLQVESAGISERVTFAGRVDSNQIPERLSAADLVILPSRWDGWGLVVNEAFSVGVPVIVSDQCGVAELVQNNINGYVFCGGDVMDLRACLRDFLDNETEREALRVGAYRTGRAISTEILSPYLIECLRHMIGETGEQPQPPWQYAPKRI